uniref:C-X-C motif chemokine n=1 Tax=Ornithorhynchus anatinus TaxID=9258 RepID=A0A6I8NJG0_ORNAN
MAAASLSAHPMSPGVTSMGFLSAQLLFPSLLPQPPLLATELRCQCVKTTQGIHHSNMAKVEVIPAGPSCANVEVIVTLKNGKNVCLNPDAPRVKKLIEKMLNG